jgi:hypothetical protein
MKSMRRLFIDIASPWRALHAILARGWERPSK